jgi:long-chain acyl-CoA synthetase
VLVGMEGVCDCAVFGIPDAEFGERLCAYVEPETGASLTEAGVCDFLQARLANFKVPRQIVFVDALPREATGKIFKRKLRDPFWEGQFRRG